MIKVEQYANKMVFSLSQVFISMKCLATLSCLMKMVAAHKRDETRWQKIQAS